MKDSLVNEDRDKLRSLKRKVIVLKYIEDIIPSLNKNLKGMIEEDIPSISLNEEEMINNVIPIWQNRNINILLDKGLKIIGNLDDIDRDVKVQLIDIFTALKSILK